jgi:3',5'-cyclic-AMP phosphodiesterase
MPCRSVRRWKGGYSRFIADDQLAWLRDDLAKTTINTFILSHQSLERPGCIENQAQVRGILEEACLPDGKRKIAACLNGHWHIDHHRIIQQIPYLHINSASYYWLGETFKHERLVPAQAKQFPLVSSTAPYTKPLFTILEIDPAAGRFSIGACASDWLGPSPQALGYRTVPGEERTVAAAISRVTESF